MFKDYPKEADLDVTVLLPAYNEEEALPSVIDDVNKVMKGTKYRYEILVVDDASTDQTPKIAQEKGVSMVQHVIQKGSGASRRTGVVHARGEIVVVLDADGTYSPQEFACMH